MADLQVIRVTTSDEMRQALAVRRTVFIEEQGVDVAIEIDEHDGDPAGLTSCIHVLGLLGGQPVATGRLLLGDGPAHDAHIGRVAVLMSYRGQGHGRAIMQILHEIGRELGYADVALAAQTHAVGFYEGLGYTPYGSVFVEAGILHQDMRLRL